MRDWSTAALETAGSGLVTGGILGMFAATGLAFLAAYLIIECERVKWGVAVAALAVLATLGMFASWTAEVYVRELIEEREVTP